MCGVGFVHFFAHHPSLEGHIRNWQSGAGVRKQVSQETEEYRGKGEFDRFSSWSFLNFQFLARPIGYLFAKKLRERKERRGEEEGREEEREGGRNQGKLSLSVKCLMIPLLSTQMRTSVRPSRGSVRMGVVSTPWGATPVSVTMASQPAPHKMSAWVSTRGCVFLPQPSCWDTQKKKNYFWFEMREKCQKLPKG